MTIKRTCMPKDLCKAMRYWDKGYISIPSQYKSFQTDLADQEIARLKELGFLEVEKTKTFYSTDIGTRLRVIKMVKNNEVYKLKWNTFNQGFLRDTGCGSFLFDVKERDTSFKQPCISPVNFGDLI